MLPPAWQPVSGARPSRHYDIAMDPGTGAIVLSRDHSPLCRARNVAEALEQFESDLDLYVAVHAPQRLFVHAGVVGWRGRAIVIPGISHSGKTTLVAALLRAGASYYSDDHAVFDLDGLVCPYPKPLFVRTALDCRTRLGPESFGATAGQESLPLGLLAVTRYVPGADWQPALLSSGQAALALLANTPCARVRPAAALRVFERALAEAKAIAGTRGEADGTARLLLRMAEEDAPR